MNAITNKYGSQGQTHDILTTNITECTSGTLRKKGGSPKLTQVGCYVNESSVDFSYYLYLHHEIIKVKWISI